MTVTALILAAGRSRRMGYPKAFLEHDGEPLICRIVRIALAAGVAEAVVVIGTEDDPALASRRTALSLLSARGLANPAHVTLACGEPDLQPIASIRAGLRAARSGDAMLLWPVDHPFATVELVRDLLAALDAPSRIVRPTVTGRGGHPVLFGAAVVPELCDPIADQGAHAVVHRDPARLICIPAVDVRLVAALNTPDQAASLGIARPALRHGP